MHVCVYLWRMTLSMCKKQLVCCEEIPTFYRQARFLLRLQITNFTEAVALFASYVATALPVNSVSVTTPAKTNYVGLPGYHPKNLGGWILLFSWFGGLNRHLPLCRTATDGRPLKSVRSQLIDQRESVTYSNAHMQGICVVLKVVAARAHRESEKWRVDGILSGEHNRRTTCEIPAQHGAIVGYNSQRKISP